MERIKDTIVSVLEGLMAKKTGNPGGDPQESVKKILTKKEYGHIKFNYFKKGILGLSVDSSSWLYSLNLKKEGILKNLKRELPDIKDIRFRIGE
jgi:hypothetical protein